MELQPESLAVSLGRPHEPGAPLSAPIVAASAYRGDGYARSSVTPTVAAFETVLAGLEGAAHGVAFSSGMAAVAAVAEGLPAGAIAVVPVTGYSGTVTIFERQQELGRLTVRPVELSDTAAVLSALDGADLLWLETITNPLLAVPDLPALIEAAHLGETLVCVDATFSTPLGCRPLALGADVVMHSATKFLGGHSDCLLGALLTSDAPLAAQLHDRRTLTGAIPGALEAYLATRGLRTLPLRFARAQESAQILAQRLSEHPRVARVRYPGLPTDPGHAIAARDFTGFGAMIAFELAGSVEDADRVCAAVELIVHATSLGSVETLIERRARHDVDAAFGTPANLLRLSVGIEHVDDLWRDLARALG